MLSLIVLFKVKGKQNPLYLTLNSALYVCPLTVSTVSSPKRKKRKKYRSVISDIFDGTIISSVQCLTCDRVSKEGKFYSLIFFQYK